jgi:tRNA nucleotidyltransferase (CCA-adding enzyme)
MQNRSTTPHTTETKTFTIPTEVRVCTETLERAGYEAYLVGGCVRDLVLGREPKDWDITTNATPAEIQALFPDSFYENDYGTVGVKTEGRDTKLAVIEITPYRKEAGYTNSRHPDTVSFTNDIREDLSRRDFTINAMSFRPATGDFLDLYHGQRDLAHKHIRTRYALHQNLDLRLLQKQCLPYMRTAQSSRK